MKVLYIYSGTRSDKFQGIPGIHFPDTALYGLNHLKDFSIDAENKEWSDALPKWMAKCFLFKGSIGFRLKHVFMFFITRQYDVVFGSSLLYMMVFRFFIPSQSKYVLMNIGLSRILRAHVQNRFRLRLIILLLKKIDAIVCLSTTQKDWLDSQYPFLKNKTYYIPLGVDTLFYQPTYEGRSDYVLAVGRDNGRDYKIVIEVAKKLPDLSFEIVCSKRNLENIGTIPENVHIMHDLPISELHKKYQSAYLMLIPTHADAFLDGSDCSGQTVLLDSLANGLPCIVTERRYLRDYIKDGDGACIVSSGDVEGIVEKIRMLHDTCRYSDFAQKARKKAEGYSTKLMAQNLADIFQRVVK